MKKTMMQICAAVAAAFIAVKQAYAVAALSSIDDVRVGPLLTSHWAQGSVGGKYCYNYYTPNHYVCGCVATALAQIMYYHRYPTERILPGEPIWASVNQAGGSPGGWSVGTDGAGSYTLSSGGASTTFDPAYGGPYDWNLMVASPTSSTSENSRKAIGRLTRDAGLAVFADYNVTSGATSGYTLARASSIILNLHYADAVRTGFNLNKLIANLDAGLPVEVGITQHDVVADGYGYHNGTLYIHINYGHGVSADDGWYDPTSTIGAANRNLEDMVANIFPPTRGARHSSVISGRVLDANGNPVANATVTASADGLSTVTTNSNAHGVYAFILPAGDYTFAVSKSGAVGSRAYTVAASSQKTRAEGDGWGNGVNNSASGIDVTLYSESDFAKSWHNNAGDGRFDNAQNWTGNTLPASGQDVAVFVSGDTVITASSAMTVGTVSVPSGTVRFSGSGSVITLGGVNLLSAASTVEITGRENLPAESIEGIGTLVVNPGAGNTYTMPQNNTSFTGLAVIKSGTVKFGDSRSFGAQPSNIRVKGGATLDENNVTQDGYSGQKNYLTLEEGATLAASSGNVTTGSPLTKMTLEGNATVDATSGIVSIADGFDFIEMEINLGTNTLTKIGSKDFYISCCEISGTGLFDVTEGRIVMAPMYYTDNSPASCSEGTMRIRSGASIHIKDNNNMVMVLTVKDLILDGSVTKGNCNHTLTVTDSISGSGTTPMLTLGSGAVFKPTGTGYLTVTESLSGIFRLDMSGVDLSSTNEVPLVSVPSALAESVRFDSTTMPEGWGVQPVPENGNVRYVLTDDDHFTEREIFHTDLLGRFAKRAQDFDVGDYVQTGLIAHFDGIRNVGADLPHDSTTRTWKNLVSGAPDATFVGEGGEWNAAGNGFVFDGSSVYAQICSPGVNMSHVNSTVQIACDVDYTQQSSGNGWFPGIFVIGKDSVDYGIFMRNTGGRSNAIEYKSYPYSSTSGYESINPWNGKYVTAAFDSNWLYLVQGTSLTGGRARTDLWNAGNRQFAWGGNPSSSTRYVKGTYHSVRIYNATLTADQLALNRYIDEMRFRGAFTASDVDIVIATSTPGAEGVEPSGEYMVNGNHTFSATDSGKWVPVGYTLEKWNANTGTWTSFATSDATSFAYTNCLANGKMRLTWNFVAQPLHATLKVAGYTGSTALTDFQALVKLSDNDNYGFSYADCETADGSDLWFTDVQGNLLSHDIDTWNTNGNSYVWVKIPTLTNNTEIVMYWGVARTAAQTCTPSDTWSGYVGVWHMNKTGSTAEPDSTSHGLSAAPLTSGNASTSLNTDTGAVGTGRSVAQSTLFKVSSHSGHLSSASVFTIGGWVKKTTDGGQYPRIFVGNPSNSDRNYWEVFAQTDTEVRPRGGSTEFSANSGINVGSSAGWNYLTVVFDGTTAYLYNKGALVKSGSIGTSKQGSFFTIGAPGSTANRSFVGIFDEVRMYNGVLSEDRIAADYATMTSPTTFITLASDPPLSALTHRWSFTSDYTDSVGGSTGTAIGSALAITDGEVVMSGNGNSTGSLNLGTGIMPSTDATIEIWATRTGVKNWARVLDIGSSTTDYFIMTWVSGTSGSGETVILKKNNVDNASNNTMLYSDNVKYHISVTFKANGDGSTTITWARRNVETGAVEKSASKTYSGWTLANLSAGNFYIGHSQWSSDYDANAKYDEVRIWNGVLSDDQLTANASMGPDVLAAGFEEGFNLADGTTFHVPADGYTASGPVRLGAGSKLLFDTASLYGQSISFYAPSYLLPSGDILDYVELTDSSNFTVTLSGNTITVTRVRRNEPDTYVEYVESDGRQWVNLSGLTQTATMKFDADIDWTSGTTFMGQNYYGQNPFRVINGTIWCRWFMNDGDSNGANTGVAPGDGRRRFVVTATSGQTLSVAVYDGTTLLTNATSSTSSSRNCSPPTLYMFAKHGGSAEGSADEYSSVKLYSLKVYGADGRLVLDLLPGIKGGVAGLYDGQKDVWYTSGSGTPLIAGSAVTPVYVGPTAVDYFVDWVQPSSANLYVDTGVRGKTGVKAEMQFLFSRPSNQQYPVMLGSWGSKRYNLIMNNNDASRWEYGNSMSDLGGLAYEGALCTADVEVSAAGLMSGTWTNSQGTRITPTMDAVAQQGVIDTGLNLFLFASNQNGSPSQCGKSRLYYCKLWEGDTGSWTLSRDLRPCVKDGVAGLYDYVTGNVLYPTNSANDGVFVAGPVAYDRIATWNGGATPTAAELATAANWSCTDKNGTFLPSVVPDRATLAVFPAGIGSVTLPDGYAAPWGAVRAEGSVPHPATQYGTCAQGRGNVVVPANDYTVAGEGSLSDLVKVNGSTSRANFAGIQMRHDGWFYVNAAQAGTWAMSIYVDDYYAFYIDDVQVLSYHSWQGGITGAATCEVSEGWHRFTSIIGDTGGGWGTATTFGSDKVPFTFTVNGTTYSLTDDMTFPKGQGTSTLTLTANADWSKLGKVALLGGATIDLNGHSLVIDDVLVDDYLGVAITNSSATKVGVLYFLGDPRESKAYATGIIKEIDEKILLARDGDQVATWTGAANDGNPANANNWEDLMGDPVIPTASYTVKIGGSNVNLQCPAGTDIACKAFEIGNCTFTADCDWRGLSHKPTITGTANLNGYVLTLNDLSAASGSTFSGGEGSFVEFVVDESATIANLYEYTYIENIGNLAFSGSAKILLRKKDGNGTLTVTRLELGNQCNGDMVQTNGTVNLGGTANAIGENSGKTSTYTMSGGSLNVAGGSEFIVGYQGTGVFNQSGGAVTLNNWFSLGRHGGTGTYTMTGGSLTANHTGNPLWIGADNGTGTLTIGPGATATFKGGIDNGRNNGANSKGYLNLNGGTLTVSRGDGFNIGRDGTGTLVQNDGTLNVDTTFRMAWGTGNGISGTYTLNDGTANVNADFYMGVGRDATYVQIGGTMNANNGVTLAYGATSTATFTLSGGVFNTKFLRKGSGTLNGVTFDGGTIVATNVTDGANFITGLNNVTYGPGGLTLDTAGYDVTMATASGANMLASGASTFTKTGSGTLTVAAVPPVGNMAVSSGTLALSASCDNASMLAHRWSFNGSLTDSVTGNTATWAKGSVTYNDGNTAARLTGTAKDTSYIELGANKIPSDSTTLEFWTTIRTRKVWTKLFCLGKDTSNVIGFTLNRDNDSGVSGLDVTGTSLLTGTGTLAADTPYYIAFTFAHNADGSTTMKGLCLDATTKAKIGSFERKVTDWNLFDRIDQRYFSLGHSFWNDWDAIVDVDEVRVWSGVLDDTALTLSAQKGPDATAADIAEISAATAVPVTRTLELASGTSLAVGSGNTLTQPVVNANGTLASGNLVVTEQINVTPGLSMTVASGATLNLTNAEIVVTGELPASGCVIATAPSGGIVTAKPRKLTGDLDGYWLFLKSDRAYIGKRKGVMIIAK